MLAQRYKKKMLKSNKNNYKSTKIITDADEACRSREISVDLNLIIVFL